MMMQGIYPIYKPVGPTSFDMVRRMREISGIRRVGHGGTLDPLAEGVLVIAVGRAYTKQLSSLIHGNKTYEAELCLGFSSNTDDAEGPLHKQTIGQVPSLELVQKTLFSFEGEIWQRPPNFSAIKVGGRRAYKLARQGKEVEIQPRQITIDSISLKSYSWPLLQITVSSGPGVYIRSLARDIGEVLGTGAYLTRLVRTAVGDYSLSDCISFDELESS